MSEGNPPSASPLAEADPKSLDVLFAMPPENMSDADVNAIVMELRKLRAQWAENEAKAGIKRAAAESEPKTPKPRKARATTQEIINLLDTLDLSK